MVTYPNQKVVSVNKDRASLDTTISVDALQFMCLSDLTPSAMKLWIYFAKNKNGFTLALSSLDAMKWGIGSKKSYDRAVKELIDKGFLIAAGGNKYDFYDVPPKAREEIQVTINKMSQWDKNDYIATLY